MRSDARRRTRTARAPRSSIGLLVALLAVSPLFGVLLPDGVVLRVLPVTAGVDCELEILLTVAEGLVSGVHERAEFPAGRLVLRVYLQLRDLLVLVHLLLEGQLARRMLNLRS